MIRGKFAFKLAGATSDKQIMLAGSEWHLFRELRAISKRGEQLGYFENFGAPLCSRSLAALNAFLRTGAMAFWRSKRISHNGLELFGGLEWKRFCSLLRLRFDGRGTRLVAAK